MKPGLGDRAIVALLLAAGAALWIAIGAIGGLTLVAVVAGVCVWILLVGIGGLTG
jgi:hypothetical protein